MNHFIDFKQITNTKTIEIINRYITCKKKTFAVYDQEYTLFTYTIKVPKNKFEDDVYSLEPELLLLLSRACSIVIHTNIIIGSIEGPTKFSGITNIDEDPEDGQDDICDTNKIYNHSEVEGWAIDNKLEIVETEKANGKFAIMTIIEHFGNKLLICGSKNNHIIIGIEDVYEETTDIVKSIIIDIKKKWKFINNEPIYKLFKDGYSLVGELCDGQHFTDGDNTISWFGFFKKGNPMETMLSLQLLNDNDIKTVPYKIVYTIDNNISELSKVYLDSRCKNTEGSVLRCRNIDTNKTILVKTKSVMYIVKRFMRQVLLKGYVNIENIKKRFIDAQSYHGLGTVASIRITKQLMNFGLWMIQKTYPVSILDHTPVTSVRGTLQNGFNTYWKEYLSDTNLSDITVVSSDFSEFDKDIYLKNTDIYKKRSFADPVLVIFLQGLQGSGKSTIASLVCEQLNKSGVKATYIEQDIYYGNTLSCQGALYHSINDANGPKILCVSRCNANKTQYKRYLEIIKGLPTQIIFIAPAKINSIYLMSSLAGILNRSTSGDNLMVGRFELPIKQVIEFTVANYKDFQIENNAYLINLLENQSPKLELECDSILSSGKIEEYIQTNWKRFNSIKLSIDDIVSQILLIINDVNNGKLNKLVYDDKPSYIGFAVKDYDRINLTNFVNENHMNDIKDYTLYIHHCTQIFLGGKISIPADNKIVKPGQLVKAHIDALIIRKSDGACAYRINKIVYDDTSVAMTHPPHITAKIPFNTKPSISYSFINLTNDSVKIIDIDYNLELIGFYA